MTLRYTPSPIRATTRRTFFRQASYEAGLLSGFDAADLIVVPSLKLGGLLRRVALCAFSKSITFECGGHVERSALCWRGASSAADLERPSSFSSNDTAISPMLMNGVEP